MAKTEAIYHDFYCLKCGQRGLPLPRKRSLQHEKFHRKRLYCPWCKVDIAHIEVRTQEELNEFTESFLAGDFEEEAEESIQHCKENPRIY